SGPVVGGVPLHPRCVRRARPRTALGCRAPRRRRHTGRRARLRSRVPGSRARRPAARRRRFEPRALVHAGRLSRRRAARARHRGRARCAAGDGAFRMNAPHHIATTTSPGERAAETAALDALLLDFMSSAPAGFVSSGATRWDRYGVDAAGAAAWDTRFEALALALCEHQMRYVEA